MLINRLYFEQSFAVGARGFADGVAEEAGKCGQSGETQLEGDISQAEIGVLQIENGLMGSIVFQVGAQTDIEVAPKVGSEIGFRHVQGFSDFGYALKAIGVLGEVFLYGVYQFG